MVVVSYSGKEINAKIVYYGPGLGGKTTNLEKIYDSVPAAHKGKMISMKTKADRTLFFDFLPIDLGDINGFRTRFMLYTVPGQVYYNATRKLVLKGVDAVVFVADSERGKMRENQESLENLRDNLRDYGLRLDDLPLVFQYNKRDLPDLYTLEEMDRALGRGERPLVEAVAADGSGVLDTLREVSALLLRKLRRELGQERPAPRRGATAVAAPPLAAGPAPPIGARVPPLAAGPPPAVAAPAPVTGGPPPPAAAPSLEVIRFGSEATPGGAPPGGRRLVVPITIDAGALEAGESIELVLELRAAGADRRRAG